jgi:pimeloyl-ACP methyl ester carboxylesterase
VTQLRYDVGPPLAALPGVRPAVVLSEALGRRADLTMVDVGTGAVRAVVLLLHGVGASHWCWLHHGDVLGALDAVSAGRSSGRVLLVMPSDGLWGWGSGYVDSGAGRHEQWVAWEVPAVVRDALGFGAEVPWFAAGLSMGGYAALRLAARHPALIRAAVGLSPVTRRADLDRFGSPTPDADGVELADLAAALVAAGGRSVDVAFTCGRGDPLVGACRELHEALDRAGVPHAYDELPGGHTWDVWRPQLPHVLARFLEST